MPLLDQPFGRLLLVALLLVTASLALRLARRRDGVFRAVTQPGGLTTATAADAPAAAAPATAPAPVPARVAVPSATATPPQGGARRASAPATTPTPEDAAAPAIVRLTAEDLGRPLGKLATLVQLSSPGCASCPQVRRVLAALAAGRPGVVHVEIDVSQRLDLARRLNVLRTPTVLVLGPTGDVRSRATGRLDPTAAAAALDAVTPASAVARAASTRPDPTTVDPTTVCPTDPPLVDALEAARA